MEAVGGKVIYTSCHKSKNCDTSLIKLFMSLMNINDTAREKEVERSFNSKVQLRTEVDLRYLHYSKSSSSGSHSKSPTVIHF